MKLINRLMWLPLLSLVVLFLLNNSITSSFGQCLPDPRPNGNPCVANQSTGSLKDTFYFCEGVTTVILPSNISAPSANIYWYKQDANSSTNTWTELVPNSGNSAISLSTPPTSPERYTVCWQIGNDGCYKSATTVVNTKNFSDQLTREKEFDLPNGDTAVFLCSNESKQPFNNAGNTKYEYFWGSNIADNSDIKNPNFRLSFPKGRLSLGNSEPELQIKDKKYGCIDKRSIKFKVHPILGPEFANIKATICENNPEQVEVRVYQVPPFKIQKATLQIGNETPLEYTDDDFAKILSTDRSLQPNTLGLNDRPINSPSTSVLIHVLKATVTATNSGPVELKFNMTNTLGCVAPEIRKQITVNPSANVVINTGTTSSNFCVNDSRVGPLTTTESGRFFSANNSKGLDSTNNPKQYFFDPKKAGAGTHNINFAVNPSGNTCAGGGAVTFTVRPAPTPKLVGRTVVCPGSIDIEYKDTAKLLNPYIRTWIIQNTSGLVIPAIVPRPYPNPAGSDSIKINFPNPFPELNNRLWVISKNDDQGCIASDTIEVSVNPLEKSPKPKGPETGCLIPGGNSLTYVPGSNLNTGFTYRWRVTQGVKVSPSNTDSSIVNVNWNVSAPAGSRTITVTDVSKKADGTDCLIESDPLIVNFINPPIADIKNPDNMIICAGEDTLLEVNSPIQGVNYSWSWRPGDTIRNISSTTINIPNPSANFITYTLLASLPNTSCPVSKISKTIIVRPTPDAFINPSQSIEHCFDDEPFLELTAGANQTLSFQVLWQRPVSNDNPDINNRTWKADTAGIYTAEVTDLSSNCSAEVSAEIVDVCPAKLFIPAAFSPNADNQNDTLKIFGKRFLSFDFKIFNRWGEIVFSTKDPNKFWDGTMGGQPAPGGVYPYVVVFESFNNKNKKISNTREGSVTLVR